MSPPAELLDVQIDGLWYQFPKGTRVIEACSQAGKFIPHYCYHPKLSSPGNCRMCLIEMGMPKQGPDRKPELGPDGKPARDVLIVGGGIVGSGALLDAASRGLRAALIEQEGLVASDPELETSR